MVIFIDWKKLNTRMKRIFGFILAIGISAGAMAQGNAAEATPPGEAPKAQKIEWLTWDQAVEKMETEPRKLMIDVYTDWCGWCKRMDATTMKDATIIQQINQDWYAVKLDGEYKKNIEFKGRTYKFVPSGRRGYHELPAELMNGKMSYPTLVFLDEEYAIIQPLAGYQKPRMLEQVLAYFGGDFYKDTPWPKFQETYQSPNGQ